MTPTTSPIATIGGRTFVFVAAEDDNGLSSFELKADGKVTLVQHEHPRRGPAGTPRERRG